MWWWGMGETKLRAQRDAAVEQAERATRLAEEAAAALVQARARIAELERHGVEASIAAERERERQLRVVHERHQKVLRSLEMELAAAREQLDTEKRAGDRIEAERDALNDEVNRLRAELARQGRA